MKKLTVMLLIAAMVLGVSACGNSANKENTATESQMSTQEAEDLDAKINELTQKENSILENHKALWEKVFNSIDKSTVEDATATNYGDFLANSLDKIKDKFTDDELKSLKEDVEEIKKLEDELQPLLEKQSANASNKDSGKEGASVFPEFHAKDLDGNDVDSSIISKNAVTVLNFWFNGCSPCVQELPELNKLNEELKEKGGQVIGINTGGKNADYIPYLANIDKNLFGISVCLLNGQTITVGDFDYRFGIESVSKVHTAILILRQYGAQKVLEMIGADATGLPFNSIIAILLENDHPSTPLVNAGAISACSMVTPIGNSDKKWDAIVQNITDLCGSAPQLIEELYKSETATNFNNRSIAWLLKNYNRIYDDPNMSLDLYTRQCSLGVTAQMLSVAAGTVANGGVNPVTKKQVFDAELTPKITSMIATVGFYEHSGDWMYTSGIPAKTGVGGGVMGVLPGVFGVSAFAPPLDGSGNSVKAQLAIKYIMNKLGLNVFNGARVTIVD